MAVYATTIFLSAFLLFQLQPMIAKSILPWFGGTASVWTTSMLFFQCALLIGYCYAHLLTSWFSVRIQWLIHGSLLAVAAFTLPVDPPVSMKPTTSEEPTWQILLILLTSIGPAFVMLATTSPLIQFWQSYRHPDRSPYRLYAMSNVGSLLALLSYPFLVERFLPLGLQSKFWSIGFIAFVLLTLYCGWSSWRNNDTSPDESERSAVGLRLTMGQLSLRSAVWLSLALIPSALLLATSNQMTQDVCSVPMLWLLPLSLYLISFILCFDSPRWYQREFYVCLLLASGILSFLLLELGTQASLPLQVFGYSLVLFAGCMVCHGELAQTKPPASHLTLFYLVIAVGGAMGGVCVALIAPNIFDGFYELNIAIIACVLLGTTAFFGWRFKRKKVVRKFQWLLVPIALIIAYQLSANIFAVPAQNRETKMLSKSRNAYGVVSVREETAPDGKRYRTFFYGRTRHGLQPLSMPELDQPISYYGPETGLGIAFQTVHDLNRAKKAQPGIENGGVRVGVIGLGIGMIAAWGEPGDSMRFYELNPEVGRIAESSFDYLSRSKASIEIVIGDARVELESELVSNGSNKFDLLVADAFSSDAIPMHLLTRECFELYLQHLEPDGVLAIHISNRYLKLQPVVYATANEFGLRSVRVVSEEKTDPFKATNEWVLLSKNRKIIELASNSANSKPWPDDMRKMVWTDDFGSIVPLVKWELIVNWNQVLHEIQSGQELP